MADNNEATALFGNMAGFCGCRGFSCLPMFFSGLSLASGFGVFETYYFEILRILHKLKRVLLLERVRLCPFHFQEDFPFWK